MAIARNSLHDRNCSVVISGVYKVAAWMVKKKAKNSRPTSTIVFRYLISRTLLRSVVSSSLGPYSFPVHFMLYIVTRMDVVEAQEIKRRSL